MWEAHLLPPVRAQGSDAAADRCLKQQVLYLVLSKCGPDPRSPRDTEAGPRYRCWAESCGSPTSSSPRVLARGLPATRASVPTPPASRRRRGSGSSQSPPLAASHDRLLRGQVRQRAVGPDARAAEGEAARQAPPLRLPAQGLHHQGGFQVRGCEAGRRRRARGHWRLRRGRAAEGG